MINRVFPVAVVALALSAGGTFAEPPMVVTDANVPGVDDSRPEPLTGTDMATVTGRGETCTEDVQTTGTIVAIVGFLGRNHILLAIGQIKLGLAPFVCAL